MASMCPSLHLSSPLFPSATDVFIRFHQSQPFESDEKRKGPFLNATLSTIDLGIWSMLESLTQPCLLSEIQPPKKLKALWCFLSPFSIPILQIHIKYCITYIGSIMYILYAYIQIYDICPKSPPTSKFLLAIGGGQVELQRHIARRRHRWDFR